MTDTRTQLRKVMGTFVRERPYYYYLIYVGDRLVTSYQDLGAAKREARRLRDDEGKDNVRLVKDSIGGLG